MAGTIPLQQLFLNKFVEVNLARYASDPDMRPLFENLTLDDITISDLVTGAPEVQTATVSSAARNFRGIQQKWLPAFLNSPNAFIALNQEAPLASAADLTAQTVPGLYLYTSGSDVLPGLVLPFNTTAGTREANAKSLFQAAFKYVINDSELTVDASTLSVLLNTYTRGSIVHAIGTEAVKVIPPTDYGRLEYPEGA